MSQLSPLALQAIEHWKQYLPSLYASLKEKGLLEERAQKAANQTNEALEEMVSGGTPWEQAWELIRNDWVFLPSEDEQARREREEASARPDWDAL